MKTLLVVGGGSGIGLATVARALACGWHVKALSRRAHDLALSHERLEKVPADALDGSAMVDALEGVDAVVQSVGVPMNLKLLTGPITLFSRSTQVLLNAMAHNACSRLVAVTGFGAGESRSAIHPLQRVPFNFVFGEAYADKSLQEGLIGGAGLSGMHLDWTIVRPGVLTNGRARPDCRVLTAPEDWKNGLVSRKSVAEFVVRSIELPEWYGKAPVLIH